MIVPQPFESFTAEPSRQAQGAEASQPRCAAGMQPWVNNKPLLINLDRRGFTLCDQPSKQRMPGA